MRHAAASGLLLVAAAANSAARTPPPPPPKGRAGGPPASVGTAPAYSGANVPTAPTVGASEAKQAAARGALTLLCLSSEPREPSPATTPLSAASASADCRERLRRALTVKPPASESPSIGEPLTQRVGIMRHGWSLGRRAVHPLASGGRLGGRADASAASDAPSEGITAFADSAGACAASGGTAAPPGAPVPSEALGLAVTKPDERRGVRLPPPATMGVSKCLALQLPPSNQCSFTFRPLPPHPPARRATNRAVERPQPPTAAHGMLGGAPPRAMATHPVPSSALPTAAAALPSPLVDREGAASVAAARGPSSQASPHVPAPAAPGAAWGVGLLAAASAAANARGLSALRHVSPSVARVQTPIGEEGAVTPPAADDYPAPDGASISTSPTASLNTSAASSRTNSRADSVTSDAIAPHVGSSRSPSVATETPDGATLGRAMAPVPSPSTIAASTCVDDDAIDDACDPGHGEASGAAAMGVPATKPLVGSGRAGDGADPSDTVAVAVARLVKAAPAAVTRRGRAGSRDQVGGTHSPPAKRQRAGSTAVAQAALAKAQGGASYAADEPSDRAPSARVACLAPIGKAGSDEDGRPRRPQRRAAAGCGSGH